MNGSLVLLALLRIGLRLEIGPEYDTNANRVEVVKGADAIDKPIAAALLRTTAKGTLAVRWEWYRAQLTAGFGSKIFFSRSVFDQSVFVGQLALDNRFRPAGPVEIGLSGDYYEATQPDRPTSCGEPECLRQRDFRTGTAQARLTLLDRGGVVALIGGYRGFKWKPDASFNFHAGQLRAVASTRLVAGREGREHEFELTATYLLEPRHFGFAAERNLCAPGTPVGPDCIVAEDHRRKDWFHEAQAELSYLGPVMLTLSYGAQLNRSNSFGQSLLRHIVSFKVGVRLPAKIYGSLKAQLLAVTYLDPVLLDRNVANQTFVSIEDENRNAVIVDLERPFPKHGLAVSARYSVYTNELSRSPARFLRQTIFVGLSYKIGSR